MLDKLVDSILLAVGRGRAQNSSFFLHKALEACEAKKYEEMVRWARMAAMKGNAEAQYLLGFSYENGLGVTEDKKEAIRHYRLAASAGNAKAQLCL